MRDPVNPQDLWRALDLTSHDFIFVLNSEYHVEYVNLSAAAAMQRGPEEVIGKPWSALFPPDYAGPQIARHRKVFETGAVLRVEEEMVFPNMTLWLDTRLCPVKGADGSTVAVLGISRDITKLKRTERAFKTSHHRLSTVLSNLPGMAYRRRHDADGTLEFVSSGSLELTGYPPEDLLQGRKASYADLIHPDDRERVMDRVHESLAGRKAFNVMYRLITAKGKQKWVWEQGRGVFSAARGLRALEGFIMDITARKRTEDDLAEQERRYRLLFEECAAALGRWDFSDIKKRLDALKRDGVQDVRAHLNAHPEEVAQCAAMVKVLEVNRAAVELFEAESKEVLRHSLSKQFSAETYDAFKEHLIAVAEGKTRFSTEVNALTLTGRRLRLLLNWAVAHGQEETFHDVLICVADLTELRTAQAEADERRREAILAREHSLAVTGRLAAGVAHEINNPLQCIMTQLELLTSELPPDAPGAKRLGPVMTSVRQIAQVTKGLFDLHRVAEIAPGACNFLNTATEVRDLAASSLQRHGVRIEVSAADAGLMIPLTCGNLSQVLLNLILNAGDAMPKGGVIRVEARRLENEVEISVADQGDGISAEDRDRIFDPFFTTKGAKGAGLGLSITRSLVKSAGGSIVVESEKGVGTVFHIRFPFAPAKEPS